MATSIFAPSRTAERLPAAAWWAALSLAAVIGLSRVSFGL